MEVALAALAIVVVLVLVALRFVRITTIYEHQRGLRFDRGRFSREIGAGRHTHLSSSAIWIVDTRPSLLTVVGQEVPSSDGVPIRSSVIASYQVTDARLALLGSASYAAAVYADVQLALRTVIAGHTVQELLTGREELHAELLAAAAPVALESGVTLRSVAFRDLTLSGDIKRAFADVVKARQEGLASLERARGETAALRNLANAAQLVERNPALMQLRLLQTVGQHENSRLVLNLPSVSATSSEDDD